MKFILRLFLILFLLALGGIGYYLTLPEGQIVAQSATQIWNIQSFKQQFSPENIGQTCPGIPAGQLYEGCFLKRESEYVSSIRLTLLTSVYESTLAYSVLSRDRAAAKLANDEKQVTRLDFLNLRLAIQVQRSLQAYKPQNAVEVEMKKAGLEEVAKMYGKMSSQVKENLDRMPAGAEPYKQLLGQYDAAVAPTPAPAALAE